jgi:hypothetical protein
MLGKGVLAIWNDCALGSESKYENCYQDEHLPERLSVQGFIRGRRYQSLLDTPVFFTWHEVDSRDILSSKQYKTYLANPTPWTQKIMKNVFLNTSRTVCHRQIISGEVFDSTAIIITTSESFESQTILGAAMTCKNSASIARIEKWVANEKPGTALWKRKLFVAPIKRYQVAFLSKS